MPPALSDVTGERSLRDWLPPHPACPLPDLLGPLHQIGPRRSSHFRRDRTHHQPSHPVGMPDRRLCADEEPQRRADNVNPHLKIELVLQRVQLVRDIGEAEWTRRPLRPARTAQIHRDDAAVAARRGVTARQLSLLPKFVQQHYRDAATPGILEEKADAAGVDVRHRCAY